ncbi:tripartite tricarboxylate transporter TctB family protein [Pacificoceanicola onchidii]|uniref:tripartite tricarboxylate transporter TctB family protein n=1 Tax=Pacificoceanicola onchidii TaxID=2562685 RepID=UPI0010A2EA4B|nr:tripartite tricarboxylate transporter TctB family protein [Pacificoceanicola onchidii]
MRLSRDLVAGGLILLLSAFLWWVTTTFDSDPLGMAQGMPATHMPRLILGVIAALTVLMILQSLSKGGEALGGLPPWQMPATAAVLGLAALLFTSLGVPLVFFGVCLTLPIMWGTRKYAAVAAFAVGVPVAIYIVFKLLLGLRLPMGPLAALGL